MCTVPAFSWFSAVASILMAVLSTDSFKEKIINITEFRTDWIAVSITCALFYFSKAYGDSELIKTKLLKIQN